MSVLSKGVHVEYCGQSAFCVWRKRKTTKDEVNEWVDRCNETDGSILEKG